MVLFEDKTHILVKFKHVFFFYQGIDPIFKYKKNLVVLLNKRNLSGSRTLLFDDEFSVRSNAKIRITWI